MWPSQYYWYSRICVYFFKAGNDKELCFMSAYTPCSTWKKIGANFLKNLVCKDLRLTFSQSEVKKRVQFCK